MFIRANVVKKLVKQAYKENGQELYYIQCAV